MTDEDSQIGDIADQLKQTEGDTEADDSDSPAPEDDSQPMETGSEESQPTAESPTEPEVDEAETSTGGPAFAFDQTEMHGFYVRAETWEDIVRMRSTVAAACSTFDVPEFEGREFQDACLQVVADHADEVALQILQERGVNADQSRIEELMDILNEQVRSD